MEALFLGYIKLCALFQGHQWNQTGVTIQNRSIQVKIGDFIDPCDLEIWQMALKNNRAPLLCYFKLCESFHSHLAIQIFSFSLETPNSGKNRQFLFLMTLEFDGWPWKPIGHLSYAPSSFVHHFIAICEFKLRVTVRKRLNWALSSVTLTFHLWPWPLAWTLLTMLINTKHNEKGVTDRRTEPFIELLGRC